MQESSNPTMQQQQKTSYLSGANAAYIEELYESYLNDPSSVSAEWQTYFAGLNAGQSTQEVSHAAIRDQLLKSAQLPRKVSVHADTSQDATRKQSQVAQLINAYRSHGHHYANLDPLNLTKGVKVPDLELSYHGLSQQDLDSVINSGLFKGLTAAPLKTIYAALKDTYCNTIGVEYMHITNNEETRWIQERLEPVHGNFHFSNSTKKHILERLTAAEGLEKYLGVKYVGQKRFSLEGGDSLIPSLDFLIDNASQQHAQEIVIGMAHRGRLNVLVNVLGKAPKDLFQEFEGKFKQTTGSGDVKYHMGFSSDVKTSNGSLHLALAFNPSHLEIIDPVVEGSVRARQTRRNDTKRDQVIPVLIHGDAAFAGQGVVMETFSLSQVRGYATGGTVHIVINNQVGFTTSNPLDARSTLYCTDIAKMVQAPVFHVNGNDPEAVVFVTQLALDFRMKFNRDVVIDLVCYRRHGHNEADEPSATQPLMYQKIKQMPTPRKLYADKLISENVLTEAEVNAMVESYRSKLDKGEEVVATIPNVVSEFTTNWQPYLNQAWDQEINTAVPYTLLQQLANKLETLPAGFKLQPQVNKMLDERREITAGKVPVNWGYAETLAYATLLSQGYAVRISGQDSGRGTFSHRHAVLNEYNTGEVYIPLQHLDVNQGQFTIIDSILSEEAVLGFEYGYATAEPRTLVIWEAQYGDFANGAQVVFDQFISSGEQKWGRLCGLTMLLPHGFEGSGPEHSSARLERYLQLCAQDNMQVCTPTTPSQMFHMLRRQMIRNYRKPLIIMSPKSMLRNKLSVSTLSDLANGQFQLVIPEIDDLDVKKVTRVVLCSGKVYFDLLESRRANNIENTAIIRVEQLYPFPQRELQVILQGYHKATEIVWCQEEPHNQGAWFAVNPEIRLLLTPNQTLKYAGRPASAAPAVGSHELHQRQQEQLLNEALT